MAQRIRKSAARRWIDKNAWIIFLAPAFFFYTLFWIIPAIGAVVISFIRWNGIGFDRIRWVGLRNCEKLLGDRFFWQSLENKMIFVFGALIFIVGPSGCGKFTLLRTIAGLEEISSGTVAIDGEAVNDLTPDEREIAMVFQSYALYPQMTLYDNMAFGLKMARASKAEIDQKVRRAADMLQLAPLLDRLPKQLSGGQRQRAAIGRAITRDPELFPV